MKRITLSLISLIITLSLLLSSCSFFGSDDPVDLSSIPEFSGSPYVEINDNVPFFTKEEKSVSSSYESYGELDSLGRCTVTIACVGVDLMPTEERGSIGMIKPTGWQTVVYDKELVDGRYLYNRCHLIGFQLTGENANDKNLITGTRYLNIKGMLPFEDMIADYVKETENHVLYRVTPIFKDYDLVARGVLMEAYSIEDDGELSFCVYAYNNQPGIVIDYATGMNRLATEEEWNGKPQPDSEKEYLAPPTASDVFKINVKSKKIHAYDCSGVEHIEDTCTGEDIASLKAQGYTMCGTCDPLIEEVWEQIEVPSSGNNSTEIILFILNKSSKTIHTEAHGSNVSESNRIEYRGTKASVITDNPGYKACGTCKPLD